MENEPLDRLVTVPINYEVVKTIKELGYKQGDDTTRVLEEVIKSFTGLDSIEELWGPEWVFFLVIIVDNVYPIIKFEKEGVKAVKNVICNMTGKPTNIHSDAIGQVTGVSLNDVGVNYYDNGDVGKYLNIATRVCVKLNIPTPAETKYLYALLRDKTHRLTSDHASVGLFIVKEGVG